MTSISTSNCCSVQLWVVRCKARSTREEAGGRTWDKATYSFLVNVLTSPDWTLTQPGRRGSLPCINLFTKSGKILPAECSPAPSLQFPAGSPQPSFQPACYQKPAVKENGLLKYEGCRYAPSCVLLKVVPFTSSCVRLH